MVENMKAQTELDVSETENRKVISSFTWRLVKKKKKGETKKKKGYRHFKIEQWKDRSALLRQSSVNRTTV